ncbi:MAG TPA: tetratricopeptide repeat protein, partial [Pyrinomonadaceae bacterium]|nr:tetratricopeptide repeat protein [Pyrinomonadaceae bacterium]
GGFLSLKKSLFRQPWLIPAILAAIFFVGGVSSNLVASDLEIILKPYRVWVWSFFAIALIATVVTAIVETRRMSHLSGSNEPDTSQSSAKEETGRIRQIPSPPADFTGRENELKELLASIEIGGVTISGLQGMGGVGKTALALKLVELLKPRYPDAQFFLDLKGASAQPLTVAEALVHVVRAYHPADKLPESESELRGLYLSVLDGKRALLLMDNAASAEQVEPLIPPASCLLLVTSRQHFTVPGLASKNLETLSAADARDLLLTIAPRIETQADEIATLCGRLPLALRLAAAAMVKYRNLSPADYVRRLQDRQQRLQLIDATLSLSYEFLSEELRERWRWLAVFPDTFADYSAAAVWEVEVDQAKYILGELLVTSLVEWNETSGRYRLHDLARLFADSKLSAEECAVGQKRFATHYRDVLTATDELYEEGGESLLHGLALFDLEWGNIQEGHAWVAAQANSADADVAELGMTYPNSGAYVLDLRQHSAERIRWLEIAVAAARQLKDRIWEGNTLGNLGIAYDHLGESRRAIQFYEQQLAISRELGDRRGEAKSLGNIGFAHDDLGESRRAIQFHEQALLIHRELRDRKGEGINLGNLGKAYFNLGETRRAIQFFEQQLAIVREIGDRRGEGHALGNLGGAYRDLGETHRAMQYLEQRLAIAREIGDRRGEGHALGYLGIVYADLGEIRRAFQYFEQRLTIARETGDRRGEGHTLRNMSLSLYQLGERAQALQYAEQALTISEQIEDPNAAEMRTTIAEWREEGTQPN